MEVGVDDWDDMEAAIMAAAISAREGGDRPCRCPLGHGHCFDGEDE